MKIKQITEINKTDISKLFEKDSNGREINIYELRDSMITGESLYYPNTLLYNGCLYNPINETTMSLKNVEVDDGFNFVPKKPIKTEENSVFFFIYNMDNYFHFVYIGDSNCFDNLLVFKKAFKIL